VKLQKKFTAESQSAQSARRVQKQKSSTITFSVFKKRDVKIIQ